MTRAPWIGSSLFMTLCPDWAAPTTMGETNSPPTPLAETEEEGWNDWPLQCSDQTAARLFDFRRMNVESALSIAKDVGYP